MFHYLNFPDTSLERALWRKKDRSVASLGKAVSRVNQRKKAKSKETKEQEEEQAIGGKDASLFLFRALGKILHCKRESYIIFHIFLVLILSLCSCIVTLMSTKWTFIE